MGRVVLGGRQGEVPFTIHEATFTVPRLCWKPCLTRDLAAGLPVPLQDNSRAGHMSTGDHSSGHVSSRTAAGCTVHPHSHTTHQGRRLEALFNSKWQAYKSHDQNADLVSRTQSCFPALYSGWRRLPSLRHTRP